MYTIELIRVGKIKRGPLAELDQKFQTQLRAYAKLKIINVNESKSPNAKTRIHEESEKLINSIRSEAKTILLTEHGHTYSSVAFSEHVEKWSEEHTRPIQFLLAGPHGVSTTLRKATDEELSLSPMTFPHDLAHTVLLEQLYRACTILHGKTYHY